MSPYLKSVALPLRLVNVKPYDRSNGQRSPVVKVEFGAPVVRGCRRLDGTATATATANALALLMALLMALAKMSAIGFVGFGFKIVTL